MTRQIHSDPTPRELEVFKYLAEGKTDQDIAQILGISAHSVRGRVHDAVLRIGAVTRCHALALLVKEGKV
jgi:LuxR family quorum sensing-dependent transcriptional regulator